MMNAYVKQMVDSRMEFLQMEEQEIQKDIDHLKEQLKKREERLKQVQEEQAALQNN